VVVGGCSLGRGPQAEDPPRRAAPAAAEAPIEAPPPAEDPAPRASRRTANAVKAAAERFLAGFVPYSYGQASGRRIGSAGAALAASLAASPPRVPPAKRRLRPRVAKVSFAGEAAGRAFVLATVDDGHARYPLTLTLARVRRGWLVTEVR
jgi:hypothetical protein